MLNHVKSMDCAIRKVDKMRKSMVGRRTINKNYRKFLNKFITIQENYNFPENELLGNDSSLLDTYRKGTNMRDQIINRLEEEYE